MTTTIKTNVSERKELAALPRKVARLEREVKLLREAVAHATRGNDPEGEYRPEFVREILKAAREKPTCAFKDAKSFLANIRSA